MQRNESVPYCEAIPPGVDIGDSGLTLESFALEKGYFRVSNASSVVLKCYQEEACRGGSDARGYCGNGYEGPCKLIAKGASSEL